MDEKKNLLYKVLALGVASFSLAHRKGKEFLSELEKEAKEKNLEENIEKRFRGLLEKLEKTAGDKKGKVADFLGIATREEIERLRKEVEEMKETKQ
jgi:polyhydroxyalkanoate synthesis regulator phasin